MAVKPETHSLAKILSLSARQLDLEPALEAHEESAAEPRLDAVDPREVDHLLAVGAEEMLGVEPLFHRGERAEELRLVVVEMHAGVIPLGLEQADIFHWQ